MANMTRRQFRARMNAKQDVSRAISALMGDGNGTVAVRASLDMSISALATAIWGRAYNNRCHWRQPGYLRRV